MVETSQTVRTIVIGKTGTGKSTLCNALLGKTSLFNVSAELNSQTKKCQIEKGVFHGHHLEVVDTPGFLDSSGSDIEVMQEVFLTLDGYKDNGFNICILPISILDTRFDQSTI